MRISTTIMIGLSLSLLCGSAAAGIYGFADQQGNPHFSTEKLDQRYQLFARGDASFNSSGPGQAAGFHYDYLPVNS